MMEEWGKEEYRRQETESKGGNNGILEERKNGVME